MSSSISGDLAGESRLLLESMGRVAEAALRPGQLLPARVIEMLLTGDVLLELGRTRVTVPTSTPLQPGDRVRIEVVTAGPTPEFRIVTDKADKTAVIPQAATAQPPPAAAGQPGPPATLNPRDLPVIMRALAEMMPDVSDVLNVSNVRNAPSAPNVPNVPNVPDMRNVPSVPNLPSLPNSPNLPNLPNAPSAVPIAQAGQAFLRAAVAAELPAAVVEQIQRVLAPLPAALPPVELAPMLRAFLAESGLFTENRLGAALREHPGPLTADQRDAITDVRHLLGALTTAGTPVPEPVRVFGEALLQQQLVVAEQVAATGIGQIAIPFMFGEERVDIRFTWEREARQEAQERSAPDDERAISLGVFVNLNVFGGIEARIVWKPESFAVTFYVEREATRAIVEAGLIDLSKELSASGFSAVVTNVWLNPDRVSAGVTPARRTVPAGTILDVMV